jgi:hypothetical protein
MHGWMGGQLGGRHPDGYGGLANGLAGGLGGMGLGGMAEYQHLANAGMLGDHGLLNGMGLAGIGGGCALLCAPRLGL